MTMRLIMGAVIVLFIVGLFWHSQRKRNQLQQLSTDISPEVGDMDVGTEKEEHYFGQYGDGVIGKARVVSPAQPVEPISAEAKQHYYQGQSQQPQQAQSHQPQLSAASQPQQTEVVTESNILVLYVLAQPEQKFSGYELMQALLGAGLRYGEMNIFHRYADEDGSNAILFSLASATNPGIIDMDNIGSFSCSGLCMFMDMDTVVNPIKAFKLMLDTAQQLADDLEARMCDDRRQTWTDAAIDVYAERLQHYQQRQHSELA